MNAGFYGNANYKNNRKNLSTRLKEWSLISERCLRYTLCFRTKASIKTEREKQMRLKYFVFHPYSHFRIAWELWMVLVYSVAFIFLPFESMHVFINKLNPKHYVNYGIYFYTIHFIFIIDMILSFCTGYVERKRKYVILDRSSIIKHYLKTYFLIDFLGTVPAILNVIPLYLNDQREVIVPRLVIINFIKLGRFFTFLGYLDNILCFYNTGKIHYKVVRIILITIFFFHSAACLLFVLPFTVMFRPITIFSDNTWIHTIQSNILRITVKQFYISSFFTATKLILSCAAMRRLHGLSHFIIVLLYTVLGIIYSCYLFIQLLDIIRTLMEPETKYDEFITQLGDYMRHNQLPTNIQQRMLLYYEHRYQKTYFREDAIVSTLSENMVKDIMLYGSRQMIKRTEILKNLSTEVQEQIMPHFIFRVYLPKDIICKARTLSRYIYFLSHGTVAIFTVSGKEVCHMYDGSYFGELCLLMKDHKMIVHVTAVEICEVYLLDRDIFLKAIATIPELFPTMLEKAKKLIKDTRAIEAHIQIQYDEVSPELQNSRNNITLI